MKKRFIKRQLRSTWLKQVPCSRFYSEENYGKPMGPKPKTKVLREKFLTKLSKLNCTSPGEYFRRNKFLGTEIFFGN